MNLSYTEFSFGYAFTENLIHSKPTPLNGAPYFPNLVQEGKLGYDIRIDLPGAPLFFQYKLPELMVRDTASEISRHSLSGLTTPFFRMHLMRRDISRQHELLIKLESKYPDSVFYATPELHSLQSFNKAYNSGTVHNRSVLFSPREIGSLPDDNPHVVSYCSCLSYAWFLSRPRKIRALRLNDVEARLRQSFDKPEYRTLRDMSQATVENLTVLFEEQIRDSEYAIRQRYRKRMESLEIQPEIDPTTKNVVEDLVVSRDIARLFLGLELIVSQPLNNDVMG